MLVLLSILVEGANGAGPLDAYVGATVEELAALIGPPDISDDRVVWRLRVLQVVEARRGLPEPGVRVTPQGVTVAPAAGELLPPTIAPLVCYIEAEVDPQDRIRAIDAAGPGCTRLHSLPLSPQ